jgi:purine-binding chemotaxis protein CheW
MTVYYVPNTPPYVRVYITLREIKLLLILGIFHLPVEKRITKQKRSDFTPRGLYYRCYCRFYRQVVSISSEEIQLPHPIFGDINLKIYKRVWSNTTYSLSDPRCRKPLREGATVPKLPHC